MKRGLLGLKMLNQRQYINDLCININPGESRRFDCPFCLNKNTLSITNNNGVFFYYCFHVNCNKKGRQEGNQLTVENCKAIINDNHKDEQWKIPDYWTSPLQNKQCLNFLRYWKILDCYIEDRVSIYYDPRQHRCVFILKDMNGEVHGATGRSLSMGVLPKWFIFNVSICHMGLVRYTNQIPHNDSIILVEDFISACICSNINTSGCILGTSIPLSTIQYLKPFSKVFIALDPDALKKSLFLQKELSPYINTKIISIKKDIKYYNSLELEELKKDLL